MKLKKLFADLKKCRDSKSKYRIKPTLHFDIDDRHYYFALLPTIRILPWIYCYPNSKGFIDIWWLNCHILIGTFEPKESK